MIMKYLKLLVNQVKLVKNEIRYDSYTLIEYFEEIKYDKPIYFGSTALEQSELHMFEFYNNVLQPSLKDLILHYMYTDTFVLSFTEGNVPDEYMDLSNLDTPI